MIPRAAARATLHTREGQRGSDALLNLHDTGTKRQGRAVLKRGVGRTELDQVRLLRGGAQVGSLMEVLTQSPLQL